MKGETTEVPASRGGQGSPEQTSHKQATSRCEQTVKRTAAPRVKYWETIANNLSRAGWTWGCVATVDRERRTILVADAHRGDGQRFVVHANDKFTAFLELDRPVSQCVGVKIGVVTQPKPGAVLLGGLRDAVLFTGGKIVPRIVTGNS